MKPLTHDIDDAQVMDLTPVQQQPAQGQQIESIGWADALKRGLEAKKAREAIINELLEPGEHFGTIPGVDKPALLKPGAEVVSDALNCWPEFVLLRVIEDFDKGLFHYVYCCNLRPRGTNVVVSSGVGSCNSFEPKYRWRQSLPKCPHCGAENLRRGRKDYGGGWYCGTKTGGCGTNYQDNDPRLANTNLSTERVPNEDVAGQVNTIDKMAQKRALVASVLLLGFSSKFTQDVEDQPRHEAQGFQAPPDERLRRPSATPPPSIDEPPHPAEGPQPAMEPEEYPEDEGYSSQNPHRPMAYYRGQVPTWDMGRSKGTAMSEMTDEDLNSACEWLEKEGRNEKGRNKDRYQMARSELTRRNLAQVWEGR